MSRQSILVIESDPTSQDIFRHFLEKCGHAVWLAGNLSEAIQVLLLPESTIDIVIVDIITSDTERDHLRGHLRACERRRGRIPVIMQLQPDVDCDFSHTLNQGIAYYLPHPCEPEHLHAVLQAAINDRLAAQALLHSMQLAKQVFCLLDSGEFSFRTLEEARSLAAMLVHACPDPERVLHGLGHLLVNAVEHGNLGLGFEEKSRRIADNSYQQEINRRLQHPLLGARKAKVRYLRDAEGIHFQIIDQGQGFSWENYLQFSKTRAVQLHGRGIALARLVSFDRLEYRDKGNHVVCSIAAGNCREAVTQKSFLTFHAKVI